MSNAPEKFLHLYLPPFLANIADKITNTEAGSKAVEKLLSKFGGNGGKRYASFLKIGKSKNQQEVFADLIAQYDDRSMRFVALSMNMEECGAGPSISGYEGQLEELMITKRQYPDQVLIFLGIDPRWHNPTDDLLDTVKTYFDTRLDVNALRSVNPFTGLKLYPSMGYYPFDERLMKTFEWAAENEVPVLSHCNYLGGIYNNSSAFIRSIIKSPNPYNGRMWQASYIEQKSFKRWLWGTQKATNNLNTCSYFMEPLAFEDVLQKYNGSKPLKICLAHFGGGNQMSDSRDPRKIPFGIAKRNWFHQIKDLMTRYKGLYTDISYALHDTTLHDLIIDELKSPLYGDRIMFGTDFFLTERELAENKTYSVFKQRAINEALDDGSPAWDKIAGSNVLSFLKSKYYDGNVI